MFLYEAVCKHTPKLGKNNCLCLSFFNPNLGQQQFSLSKSNKCVLESLFLF